MDDRYRIQVPQHLVTTTPETGPALPVHWCKRTATYVLYLQARQITVAKNRQRVTQQQQAAKQLRPAVEATVRSVKHPFAGGQAPVRGQIRMGLVLVHHGGNPSVVSSD